MALVLTTILVWYTFVSVPYAAASRPALRAPGDEGLDGEVRPAVGGREAPVEELDWPEFIGLD
jgi:hypothetical protein